MLYVPRLGVNLMSSQRIYMSGLRGSFDSYHLYFDQGKDRIITITIEDRLYIITNIADSYKQKAFLLVNTAKVDTANMLGQVDNCQFLQEEKIKPSDKERYML